MNVRFIAVFAALLVGAVLIAMLFDRSRRPTETAGPTVVASESRSQLPHEMQSPLTFRRVATTETLESQDPSQSGREEYPVGTLGGQLEALRAAIEVLPAFDGTDLGIQQKYHGMTPKDLALALPILSELRLEETYAALDEAIETGNYERVVLPPGELLDYNSFKAPGATFAAVAHRAEPLGTTGTAFKVVSFSPTRYPDVYLRAYEELWVHDQIDQAGFCPADGECKHSPPVRVREPSR